MGNNDIKIAELKERLAQIKAMANANDFIVEELLITNLISILNHALTADRLVDIGGNILVAPQDVDRCIAIMRELDNSLAKSDTFKK